MGVLNDWTCRVCGSEIRDVVLPSGDSPKCCGTAMLTLWDRGKAPATDMRSTMYSPATRKFHNSTREVENELSSWARDLAARSGKKFRAPKLALDKHHGAPLYDQDKGVPVYYKRKYKVKKEN